METDNSVYRLGERFKLKAKPLFSTSYRKNVWIHHDPQGYTSIRLQLTLNLFACYVIVTGVRSSDVNTFPIKVF